jgi:hypothetical protein
MKGKCLRILLYCLKAINFLELKNLQNLTIRNHKNTHSFSCTFEKKINQKNNISKVDKMESIT